ncbi:carbon-nitrogen hydrolase family protein [Rhodococcus fascians]|nr:carbon-nitrogen hydrolase family protein [Rhodococcus fascians]MBY3995193.1 carbon-nitrogen hydrolase family protein [Rhodococcus fascians]MBY4000487.1 carbon-nitrogen hydrolase family protein [Rhodococcus fascians]MBY4005515.1 carbon-nitrogen hydrolase family protein [Rhodococcus fascians]MBY4016348.1 carbon-nitrogen hydrolase family protein [Rhodococcus fascians]
MSDYTKKFRAAVVQAEPVWNDVDGGIDKTAELALQAAAAGADIIAFPEVWIPGYPWFLWLDSVAWQSQFVVPYVNNSIEVGSSQFARLEDAARTAGIAMSLGFSERENGSLYVSQAFIDKHGVTRTVRRKLKPTHVERTMFGEGDGSDIQVIDTDLGRVGALNCWEHLQPLAKYAMFSQGEQLHVAAWPSFSIFEGAVNALGPEVNVGAARQYAVEGQTFVLSPTGLVGAAAQALVADTEMKKQFLALGGGHARIFGPDGRDLAEPLAPTEEGILYADIDYSAILAAKNAADPVGHYSRPDVFRLYFDNSRKSRVVTRPLSPSVAPSDTDYAHVLE